MVEASGEHRVISDVVRQMHLFCATVKTEYG